MSVLDPSVEKQLTSALAAATAGNISVAIEELEEFSDLQIPEVDSMLGMWLVNSGDSVETRERGLRLLRRAARVGDTAAAHNLQVALLGLAMVEVDPATSGLLRQEAQAWAAKFGWASTGSSEGRVVSQATISELGEVIYEIEVDARPGRVVVTPLDMWVVGDFSFFERNAALRAVDARISADERAHGAQLMAAARLRNAAGNPSAIAGAFGGVIEVKSVELKGRESEVSVAVDGVLVRVSISRIGVAMIDCVEWQMLTPARRSAAAAAAVGHLLALESSVEGAVDKERLRLLWGPNLNA